MGGKGSGTSGQRLSAVEKFFQEGWKVNDLLNSGDWAFPKVIHKVGSSHLYLKTGQRGAERVSTLPTDVRRLEPSDGN